MSTSTPAPPGTASPGTALPLTAPTGGAPAGVRVAEPPVDPRGVRFAAALTSAVLALVLLTDSGGLLAAQAGVFALGAVAGLRFAPYSVLFRHLVAPRLGPPTEREEAAPVRFSQLVGLAFAVVGTVGYLGGLTAVGVAATALALAAAFLNAAFGFCLGCEMYPVVARLRARLGPGRRRAAADAGRARPHSPEPHSPEPHSSEPQSPGPHSPGQGAST
jgi:hypothetical protein